VPAAAAAGAAAADALAKTEPAVTAAVAAVAVEVPSVSAPAEDGHSDWKIADPLPQLAAATVPAAVPAAAATLPAEQRLPFEHAIIGYWGTGAKTPFEGLEGPTVADALRHGYNTILVAYADTFSVNGSFELHTDMCPGYNAHAEHAHECAPSKEAISKQANMSSSAWRYLLSFGGKDGAGPYMSALLNMQERAAQEDAFADGFLKRYAEVKAQYGFDGIDIDVESTLTTPLLSAFRKVFEKLHAQGELVSVAPETPSLNPAEMDSFFEGSFNSYAPLVDSSIIDSVSWVAPRLYNDALPQRSNISKYVASLHAGHSLEWDGRQIDIKIPPSKLILGHPASPEAAPARELDSWQKDPSALVDLYHSSPDLQATKGVMAWSIGHDYASGWKWVTAAKQIWL
jgi:chitinase